MATGYTRQSSANIVPGTGIRATHLNAEYNAIEAALNASTGHNHDGTVGGGAPIQSKILRNGQTGSYVVVATDLGKVIDVSSSTAATVTLLAAGTAGAGFSLYVRNSGTADVTISPNVDGASLVLKSKQAVQLQSDGTGWLSLAKNSAASASGGGSVSLARHFLSL